MADQEGGVPAPNPPPAQQQQGHTSQQQQVVHLNWSISNQNFQENLMKTQKHTCSAQTFG